MDYVRIMERTLELVVESSVHVRYNLARDGEGVAAVEPSDARARHFSLEGAFSRAFDEERRRAYTRARSLLERRVLSRRDTSLSIWNDSVSKEEIVAVIEEAIADVRVHGRLSPEREIARCLCDKYGASKTARLVRDGACCYPEILRSALNEVGASVLVQVLRESGVRVWGDMAIRYLDLREEDIAALRA